ncbi:hypothetical protein ES703_80674 [subsurface metagenome]
MAIEKREKALLKQNKKGGGDLGMKYEASLVFPNNNRFDIEDDDLNSLLSRVKDALDCSGVNTIVEVRRIEEEIPGEEMGAGSEVVIAQIHWKINIESPNEMTEEESSLFTKNIYR